MHVVLLEPPKIPWEMMGDVVAPPLGLAQLAGCLEQAGISVEILDANALEIPWSGLESALTKAQPALIGMTVFTPFVPEIARAVQIARRAVPGAVIVLGGPHVTFTAEETLQTMPEADIVARGEGDQIIVDLAQAVDTGAGIEDIPGLSYRRGGTVVHNPAAPPLDISQSPL
ncbi:MAG: cobalamin-dependent protein, partial [Anaerolineae bacterium]